MKHTVLYSGQWEEMYYNIATPRFPPPEGSSPQNKELLNSSDDEEMHTIGEKGSPDLGNDETGSMSTMFASTLSDVSSEFDACSFRGGHKTCES